MSNYYDYREVKVMIAHKLMNIEGWKVYGYYPDESDSMTDYYSPAHWDGVAEKNGYILCVNVYGASEGQDIKQYNNMSNNYNNAKIVSKIEQLKQFTTDRGATEAEEATAKKRIEVLTLKMKEEQEENNNNYTIVGRIPAHQANPPKCNWHIEKDGIIVAKGNGILKYYDVYNYYSYDSYKKDLVEYKENKNYFENHVNDLLHHGYYDTKEKAETQAKYHMVKLEKDIKLVEKFESFINKLDTTCGCLVGNGEIEQFEKITVTEYKKELKAIETTYGSIKEGQCFILKAGFNYNRYKGLVYRMHESEYNGKKYFNAYKLNGKLTKECTGKANANNSWSYIDESFLKWIEKGSISWCDIQEVKTPYQVEKLVKKTLSNTIKTEKQDEQTTTLNENTYTYEIKEDIDTRDNSTIYVVKIIEKLEREEYIKVNSNMKKLGGYYSKFKHGFIFKDNPASLLANENNTSIEINKTNDEVKLSNRQKTIDKINKQIDSINAKISSLSGEYKTNTYKRMNEQANREAKIDKYVIEIEILNYILDTVGNRELAIFENALIIGAFRELINSYYLSHKRYKESSHSTTARDIKYPEIDSNLPLNSWYNEEVPAKQNKLKKGGIFNTNDLIKAVESYEIIFNTCHKPYDVKGKKIKELERQFKMQQKGDINFTPSNVAKQLVELAQINKNSIVLEPSAGIGNIADKIKEVSQNIDVCEQMYSFCELLELKGYNVIKGDFLGYATSKKYDAIIMNPPFSDEQSHIKHAYDMLADGGTLVSITSPHWTFANDKNTVNFRSWLDNETYYTKDLQSGTFEMTNVASKILVIEKALNNIEQTA